MLTENRILITAMISWIIAQVLKTFIHLLTQRKFDFRRLVGSGGMPSAHAAFTIALVTSVGKYVGLASPSFAIAACFALVVMYDASGVRRAAGEQAKILNYMMEHWKENSPELFEKTLKELLGHTPVEVVAGALLGVAVGLVL